MPNEEDIKQIFRAYDIRGVFGKDLVPHVATKASTIYGNMIQAEGETTVSVSGDGRKTTPPLLDAVAAGIASAGVNVKKYRALPIPVANFKTWQDMDGGAFITASHNPAQWNGIRYRRADGTGFAKENKTVRNRYFANQVQTAEWQETGNIYHGESEEVLAEYTRFVLQQGFSFEKELNIVVDPRNGMAGTIAPHLYGKHANVLSVNSHIDPTFEAGSLDPVHGDISETQRIIKDPHVDGGVVFDGDGDRSVLIDEHGQRVSPEVMGIIIARELLDPGDTVVHNVSCSSILPEKLKEEGIDTVECRVGDVFVAEEIKQHDAQMGLEGSYHFFLPKYGFYYDDAIFFTYVLLAALSKKEKTISQLVDAIGDIPTTKSNVEVAENDKPRVMQRLKEQLSIDYEVKTIDGVKAYLDKGTVLIRPSNTEPVIRIYTEWKEKEELETIHQKFENMVIETRKKL